MMRRYWALLVAAACIAVAQDGSWEQEMRNATHLQADGRYAAAEAAFAGLLKKVEMLGPDDPKVITTLHNLGSLYHEMERFAEAEKLYLTSIAAWERSGDAARQYLLRGLINLAGLHTHAGQFSQADRVHRRLETLIDGNETEDAGRYYQDAAYLYFRRGNYNQSEALCHKALAIFEKLPGNQHPNLATTVNNLGMIRMRTNRVDEALPFFEKALAIWERTAGRDSPAVIVPLMNIAWFRVRERNFPEAQNLSKRALKTAETTYGPNSPVAARTLSSYAELLRKMGRKSEARLVERRVKTIGALTWQSRPVTHTIDVADFRR